MEDISSSPATMPKVCLPTSAEVREAFESLQSQSIRSLRICFFIDGLDEFSGNYFTAIAFLNNNLRTV